MHRILASTIIQAHIGGSVCRKRRRTSRVFAILPAAANGSYLRLVQLPLPVTPFHLGPGALLKAVAPKHVSWTAFALANGLIDLEPILYFLFTGDPAHRFFHTLPGASLAALVAVWPGRSVCEMWLRFWNRQLSTGQSRWLGSSVHVPLASALVGALLGAWSHIGLDMAMHVDVLPIWPLVNVNRWHGWISLDGLHLLCLTSALCAAVLWMVFKKIRKAMRPREAGD